MRCRGPSNRAGMDRGRERSKIFGICSLSRAAQQCCWRKGDRIRTRPSLRDRAIAHGLARTLAVRVPLVLTCEGGDGAGCHCAHAISVCSRHAAQLFPAMLCSRPSIPGQPRRLRCCRAAPLAGATRASAVAARFISDAVTIKQFHYCIRYYETIPLLYSGDLAKHAGVAAGRRGMPVAARGERMGCWAYPAVVSCTARSIRGPAEVLHAVVAPPPPPSLLLSLALTKSGEASAAQVHCWPPLRTNEPGRERHATQQTAQNMRRRVRRRIRAKAQARPAQQDLFDKGERWRQVLPENRGRHGQAGAIGRSKSTLTSPLGTDAPDARPPLLTNKPSRDRRATQQTPDVT